MATEPTGKVVRNIFALRKYENGLARQLATEFENSARRLERILRRLDPTSVSAGRLRKRLQVLNRAANEALRKLYTGVEQVAVEELLDVARAEAEFAAGILRDAAGAAVDIETPRIGRTFARSIAQGEVFSGKYALHVQGETMRKWWQAQEAATQLAFRTQVQLGLAQNETIDQIVRRVRGRSAGGGRFVGGIMQTSTKKAQALARTAVNEIATKAHYETYAANSDVTNKYELVVTFDSRTSDICISLDGKTYGYDDPSRKMPPFHFNCRTTIAPVVDWKGLGIKPPPEFERAAQGGPVPASQRYGDWLKNQDVATQNQILGRGRAELWRQGKLDLRDLVRSDGSSITLGELERKLGLPKGWQRGGGGPSGPAGPSVLSAENRVKLKSFEERHLSEEFEYGLAFDKRGASLEKIGDRHSVTWTREELSYTKDALVTHSHPSGRSFSGNDVHVAIEYNQAEMRAFGTDYAGNRWIYRMRRPEGGWPVWEDVEAALKAEQATWSEGTLSQRLADMADETKQQMWQTQGAHDIWVATAKKMGLLYDRIAWRDWQ